MGTEELLFNGGAENLLALSKMEIVLLIMCEHIRERTAQLMVN